MSKFAANLTHLSCGAVVAVAFGTARPAGADPLPEPTIPEVMGVQLKNGPDWTCERLRKAHAMGFRIVRKGMYWNAVEKVKGVYVFSDYDEQMACAQELGLTVVVTLFGGKANGASSVTHHYRLNGGDWLTFTEDAKDIVVDNNVFIEFKTVNEAETSSTVVSKTIKVEKVIYEDNQGYPIERYVINEYELFSNGESVKTTALKGGYDDINDRYYEFYEYPRGDSYIGCGVKAAQIFVRWFGISLPQSIVADEYVETTNVAWLDSWIFTTPAQLEDGVQDILDDSDFDFELSRRSLNSTAGAVTWIQNQLAAGYPVIILANDGDHWQVITEAIVSRDRYGDIEYATFLTHDNGGKEWRTWGELDYFFEENWSAEVARFIGYSSYRDCMISVDIGQ
ncbi:MAG: hypothetical protein EOM87_00315 [Clostridia bacterium]|nr:hypothetical protein [Clostridia bacterium]